jgi:hypothetical protein
MFLKNCECCGIQIKAKSKSKKFCSRSCILKKYFENPEKRIARQNYQKEYCNEPENKKRLKEWQKNYRQRSDIKEKHRVLAVTKYRERRKKYWEDYGKRPEVRARINQRDRNRRKIDKGYVIMDRLRRSLNHAFTKYSKTGKIMNSKKYGIDWEKVIESLKPFPENLQNFEIDHIIPLCKFDLTKNSEIIEAFSPSNLQWLTIEENRRKSGKILKEMEIIKSMKLSEGLEILK